ncbi:unnamed protein product [Blepharisma stoltei]|uniref:Uncharacterized protein n=1 Tax=Blepharisma stoltei TaxID=1481888 RepID=A0AAU9JHL0_9CILI|nr:unnamed protein product [Blepharisma stoltei]
MSKNNTTYQIQRSQFLFRDNIQTPYITNPFGKHLSQFTKTVKPLRVNPHSRADGPLIRSQQFIRTPSPQKTFISFSRQETFEISPFQRSYSRTNSTPRLKRPPTQTSFSMTKQMSFQRLPSPTSKD